MKKKMSVKNNNTKQEIINKETVCEMQRKIIYFWIKKKDWIAWKGSDKEIVTEIKEEKNYRERKKKKVGNMAGVNVINNLSSFIYCF